MVCLSGPIMVFGFVVDVGVVVLWTSCAVAAAGVCVLVAVVEPPCVGLLLLGAAFVVELPLFFFALGVTVDVDVLCAVAIDPAARKAPTQKLAANFRYRFIVHLSKYFFSTASSTPTPTHRVDTTSASPSGRSCGPPHAVIQTNYSSLLRQI
jgi:hypothetical protein